MKARGREAIRRRTMPLVSVVIPVLNDRGGIARVLGALDRQTYPRDSFEVLVIDNGSADGTREVVEGFAGENSGVRLLTEFNTRSSYAARNTGIAAAGGSILAFTDADCVPEATWLEEGVRALESERAAYAAGRVDMTFRGSRPNVWEYYDAVGKLNQQRYLERYGFGATANLFVRRDRVEAHGRFRGDLVSGGDYEFGRRLAKAGERGVYADRAVVRHAARATARAVLKKERRILRGRRQLEALGLLDHGLLTWRSFVPVRRCPPLAGHTPGPARRLGFLVVANFVRYTMLALRLLRHD